MSHDPLSSPSLARVTLAVLSSMLLLAACSRPADEATSRSGEGAPIASSEAPPRPTGLLVNADGVAPGYVLYSPLSSGTTYLLDTEGRAVHTWESEFAPHSLYLLPNGDLLRPGRDPQARKFTAGGAMGMLQRFDWEGNLLWQWKLSDENRILHHDVEPLPNGNLLANGWEVKTREEALAAGRRPDLIPEEGLWTDFVVEIEPLPPDDARIVWEWNAWDHMVQDYDPDAANYGDPSDHPEKIDLNAGGPQVEIDAEQLAELRALGYIPDTAEGEEAEAEGSDLRPDFLHVNSVDWHPELDQIAMTPPERGEVWVIRRPRSTEEAAGPTGDLIYRWGNPETYGRGTAEDKRLFFPHDVQWIPPGYPGEGNMTIFNNGNGRPEGAWSSVEEIVPPLEEDGSYELEPGAAYGPAEPVWSYRAAEPETFYAPFISGAHRLPNGNTFVTSGPKGRFFEVTADGRTVWEFWNPYWGNVRESDGTRPWSGDDRLLFGVWRAEKLTPDHPGLAGRDLAPLDPQPEIVAPPPPSIEQGPVDEPGQEEGGAS
jgi:hypothetical protein